MARSSDKPRLELDRIRKTFGPVVAVDEMSLAVRAGEFVSLLGPSGCGKSTTLAMIAGFERPTAGQVRIDGERVDDRPPQARRVGLVFQDYAIFTRMTVFENLAYGLRARGSGRAETRRRVAAIAELLDLGAVLGHRVIGLNVSELQRVALGRVLVLEPAILLLDEPLSNLDAGLRARLRVELRRLTQELGQTVVYVTHDFVEALAMSDRVAIMHQGRIEQVGSPSDVYDCPRTRFVAEFLGEPPINIVPCVFDHTTASVVVPGTALRVPWRGRIPPAASGPWCLGVRPHHVALCSDAGDGAAPGEVELVEPLGSETAVHVRIGGQRLAALVPPSLPVKPSQRWWVRIEPGRVLLFHAATGEAA